MNLRDFIAIIKKYKWIILIIFIIFALTAAIELGLGRLLLGPDGKFGCPIRPV